jgi:LDH2 family malate/lactate/ureidoglycolate dehydrogenase
MSTSSSTSTALRIPHADLVRQIRAVLIARSLPEPIAQIEAELMAEADLLGTPSHGIRMLPRVLASLHTGLLNPSPQIKVLADFGAICRIDGDHGPGRYLSVLAMNKAIEKAGLFGIGACLLSRAGHWGRAHAYAYRAAQAGMIGICMTNAMPSMLAFGSDHVRLGNNPLALSIPRRNAQDPVVLDIAMSQAAVGKIMTYQREGKKAPPGWGLDQSGKPTDDPAAILASRNFLPMGEHKGSGLALIIELMTAALAGGLLCHELGLQDSSGMDIECSKLFLALNPLAFGQLEVFSQRVEDLLTYLQSSPSGVSPVLFPGEHGWQTRDQFLKTGIPMETETLTALAKDGIIIQ